MKSGVKMIKDTMIMKILRSMLFWGLMGIFYVLVKRLIRYGFTGAVFLNDYKSDFIIGSSVALLVGLNNDLKK